MTRRILLAAITTTALLVGAHPASAAPASCGATSPTVYACSTSDTLDCCSYSIGQWTGAFFIGSVTSTMTQTGYTFTRTCSYFLPALFPPSCSDSVSGSPVYGAPYLLSGSASPNSVGDWAVQVVN